MKVNIAGGTVDASALGKTLMHEHLTVGMPGWQTDTRLAPPDRREMVAICVDKVQELQAGGYTSMVDPCPSDLGRDHDLIGEVAARTGFNIIFAAGLYNEHAGGSTYWNLALRADPDGVQRLADVFIGEIEDGIGGSGLCPGIIKIGTAFPPFSEYEKGVFRAAAIASKATGTPITTHTESVLGDEQLALLTGEGVDPGRIVIGHCCETTDHDYHMHIIDRGAYAGFDRFNQLHQVTDEQRVESLARIHGKGGLDRVILSHDSLWCWQGAPMPPESMQRMAAKSPMYISNVVAPLMIAAGIGADVIESMLIDNPRRYFSA